MGLLSALAGAEPIGQVKFTSGQVTRQRLAQVAPVQAGDLVEGGDVLRTAADGRCSLTLIDGARLVLGPGSQMTLTQFTWDPTTRTGASVTHLHQGQAVVSSGGLAQEGQPMEVTTPRSRIQMQATTLAVEVRR